MPEQVQGSTAAQRHCRHGVERLSRAADVVGTGILVEVARRLGMGFIASRDELAAQKAQEADWARLRQASIAIATIDSRPMSATTPASARFCDGLSRAGVIVSATGQLTTLPLE